MTWNLSAECVSLVIAFIVLSYSRMGTLTPSLKNRVFQGCLIVTIASIALNITSTLLIEEATVESIPLTWIITTLYFFATPLISTMYYLYTLAVVSEARPRSRALLLVGIVPYALYFFCVLTNLWTGGIFYLDANGGYHQGNIILITYVVFYFSCFACFALAISSRADIDPAITKILTFFPLLAVVVIVVQQITPQYILTGSAATCSLLIVYLYLQNKQISIDFLTRIPNRQEFAKMIALEQKRSASFSAVIVSINGFKFINDKFGHQNGDNFLREFASYLSVHAKTPWLYRYSGDQFVVLFENSQRSSVAEFLRALQARMDEPWKIEGYPYVLSASIGVVEYPEIASDSGTLISALESSVEGSKALGLNTPCYCTESMLEAIKRKRQVTDILRKALSQDGLTLHYQPIWSISQQKFITAEALCRLTSDELGAISPTEFIPIAEETGMIIEMTYDILDKACAFMEGIKHRHPETAFESVSVNFSATQFMQNDLTERMTAILASHDVDPSRIKIEITESVLVTNPDVVKRFIVDMQAKGVQFCLDDFGTDYSNLSMLLDLPFDVVKLDKSIVWMAVTQQNRSGAVLEHLSAAFVAMGSTVLAEGVETLEQSTFVGACGCDLIQGFFYAKPVCATEAEQIITQGE